MNNLALMFKVVPTICATIGLISAHYHGLNHQLTFYILLAILGLDIVSLKMEREKDEPR